MNISVLPGWQSLLQLSHEGADYVRGLIEINLQEAIEDYEEENNIRFNVYQIKSFVLYFEDYWSAREKDEKSIDEHKAFIDNFVNGFDYNDLLVRWIEEKGIVFN